MRYQGSVAWRALCMVALVSPLVVSGVGCAGKQKKDSEDAILKANAVRYRWPDAASFSEQEKEALNLWFIGDEGGARAAIEALGEEELLERSRVETLFMTAEMDYWAGDMERAFTRHLALIKRAPSHPLARQSAARIHDLSDDVVRYTDRVEAALGDVRFGEVHPLTASYLSMAGQAARLYTWRRERTPEPFDAASVGLPNFWMRTPILSRYRLSEFDRAFAPERDTQLAATYISPADAEDVETNREPSYPFISSSTSLSPQLNQSGIYYLETFATVTADTTQTYWVYGSFAGAARVWIDGEEVLERREGSYASGKQWRRVNLTPGTHRVLLKLANQPNYRDWFDLAFLNSEGTMKGGSALTFANTPPSRDFRPPEGGAQVLSALYDQHQLEPFLLHFGDQTSASPEELYLGALAAHYDRHNESFLVAYQALVERYPDFAAAHGLRSLQVQTLWEMPSSMRDDLAMRSLRLANQADPQSISFALMLGSWLKKRGESDEVKTLLRTASDLAVERSPDGSVRLRNSRALNTWAGYLEGEGWDELAEEAYRAALTVEPANCGAATALQGLLYMRDDILPPAEISSAHERCPLLYETWVKRLDTRGFDEQFALIERTAARYPYSDSAQLNLVRALEARGEQELANEKLDAALAREPWSRTLLAERIDRLLTAGKQDEALAALDRYQATHGKGNASWSENQRAVITGTLPLVDLMQDGVKTATTLASKEPVSGANSAGDEAFYVIDFAAKKYYQDGSSVELVHTLVRVMTKSAIDRFAEVSLPDGVQLVEARTIKQDGSVQTPARVSGKDTLSMPGLAPGDFVELAYLDYDGAYLSSRTHRKGTRFFFQMQQISSLRSEYVIINPSGEVLRMHDAPEPEEFTYNGEPAVRFLRTNSPRPRAEPRTVDADEFLPWVQLVREGASVPAPEQERLFRREQYLDSMRLSSEAESRLKALATSVEAESQDERVKQIFYAVTDFFESSSSSLNQELTHSVLEKDGNPMLALKAIYDRLGIEADVFIVRNKVASPVYHPIFEFGQYATYMLRVKMPESGKIAWLSSFEKDAMFDSLSPYVFGEPAVCISCEERVEDTLPNHDVYKDFRYIERSFKTSLDANGDLTGKATFTMKGDFASYIRKVLRQRQEPRQRQQLMDNFINNELPGSAIEDFTINNVEARDEPLEFVIDFKRENFARKEGGALVIEMPLFQTGIEQAYATLPERSTPLMLGRPLLESSSLLIDLPDGKKATLRSVKGENTYESPYGTIHREALVAEDGTVRIASDVDVEIARVPQADYPAFQKWARDVAQSEVLLLTIE